MSYDWNGSQTRRRRILKLLLLSPLAIAIFIILYNFM